MADSLRTDPRVEIVARALYTDDFFARTSTSVRQHFRWPDDAVSLWEREPDELRGYWFAKARAVLIALDELDAGEDCHA